MTLTVQRMQIISNKYQQIFHTRRIFPVQLSQVVSNKYYHTTLISAGHSPCNFRSSLPNITTRLSQLYDNDRKKLQVISNKHNHTTFITGRATVASCQHQIYHTTFKLCNTGRVTVGNHHQTLSNNLCNWSKLTV
jgi:hypothetical protein